MHDQPLQVVPAKLYLPQFGVEVPVLRISGMGDYFPIRAFCKAIGIPSQPQLQRIQDDPDFAEGTEILSVSTAGGPQESVCLRKREIAWWLSTLDPRTVRKLEAHLGTTLKEFKQAVMDAADRLWWGVADVPAEHALQTVEPHGTLWLHCRRCRARHRLEFASGTVSWEIDEDD